MIYRGLVALGLVASVAAGGVAYRRTRKAPARPERVDPGVLPVEAPAVVAFTSELCLACRRTPAIVAEALGLDEDELRDGDARLAFAHVDVADRPQLARAFDVTSTPTVALVTAEGRIPYLAARNPEPGELADELAGLAEV